VADDRCRRSRGLQSASKLAHQHNGHALIGFAEVFVKMPERLGEIRDKVIETVSWPVCVSQSP